jgi:hypothetical protein
LNGILVRKNVNVKDSLTAFIAPTALAEANSINASDRSHTHPQVSEKLQPQLGVARDFLEGMTGTDSHTFQWFSESEGAPVVSQNMFETIANAWDTIKGLNNKGAGIFWTPNETDGKGRKTRNITRVRFYFTDLDGAPIQPVLDCPLKPHCIVTTSPDRYHVYWRVSDGKLEEFAAIQKALAERFNGDLKVKDLPRCLRLPGSLHQKRNPFLVQVYEANYNLPDYSTARIVEGLGLSMKPKKERRSNSQSGSPGPVTVPDIAHELIPEGQRHDHLLKEAGRFHNLGYSEDVILGFLRTINNNRFTVPQNDNDLVRIARDISKKESSYRPIEIVSLARMNETEYEPVEFVVDELVPQGLTLLVGAPKTCKSFFALQTNICVLQGKPLFGKFAAKQAAVIHVTYEETPYHFNERSRMLTRGEPIPDLGCILHKLAPYCANEQESGLTRLQELVHRTDAKLIIIDPLVLFLPGFKFTMGTYRDEYRLFNTLQKFALDNKLALLGTIHDPKGCGEDAVNSVIGSIAAAGASDAILRLQAIDKNRNNPQRTLTIVGRNFKDYERKDLLEFNDGVWVHHGSACQLRETILSRKLREIFSRANKKLLSNGEIMELSGLPPEKKGTLYNELSDAVEIGLLRREGRGQYRLNADADYVSGEPVDGSINL